MDREASKEVKERADKAAETVSGEVREAVEGAEQDVRDADRRAELDRIADRAAGRDL